VKFKSVKAFAILEVMLATMLLIGLVYLIMHSMSTFHRGESDKQLGVELSPVISNVIQTIGSTEPSNMKINTDQNLIHDASAAKICPDNTSGLLANVSSGFLDSMEISNFSLCTAKVVITKIS